MWTATDFKTKRLVRTISLHVINLNDIAITIAKLTKSMFFFRSNLCRIFFPGYVQIFADLLVYNILNFFDLIGCYFFGMRKVKTQTLFGYITAALDNMIAQD